MTYIHYLIFYQKSPCMNECIEFICVIIGYLFFFSIDKITNNSSNSIA